ncbi:hypothetical protein [Prescottella equi]
MSAFEDRMKNLATVMSPEAKSVVTKVLASEHNFRFGNRDELPELYATLALKAAKEKEDSQ